MISPIVFADAGPSTTVQRASAER